MGDPFTEAEAHLDRYCVDPVPRYVQDKVHIGYVAKGMAITLFEQRPRWKNKTVWTKSDVARARYSKADGTWMLYCRDQFGERRPLARRIGKKVRTASRAECRACSMIYISPNRQPQYSICFARIAIYSG